MNTQTNVNFDPTTQKNIERWLNGNYDENTKTEIRNLLANDPKQAVDAFYTDLTFGTAGLRGIMGVGTNRMNLYTVRAATQGLANYLNKQPRTLSQRHSVFIGYDSRHNSREFTEETAKVLASNGIQVYVFKDIRPTPLVSFACRYKKCTSAIMITASHNPPAYNGYKVYWSDGGQLVPPHDTGVIAEVNKITDPSMVKIADSFIHPLIQEVDHEIDDAYIKAIIPLQNTPKDNQSIGKNLKVVYTSLHGTGIKVIPKALATWGFTNVSYVEKQIIPDGDFPTVKSPNPEEHAALKLGIEMLIQTQSDILIATDPDADRMAAVCRHHGIPILLTGNQIAAICLEHVCYFLSQQKRLPEKAGFIKTIGTTELFQSICDHYQKHCCNVLTGFKYIAEKILEWESQPNGYQYVFGGEESYGYLLGTQCRDKDAVVSSALICEAALQAQKEGKTLIDKLHDLYKKYGIFQESLLSINFGETKEGKEQMIISMERLRKSIPEKINNIVVVSLEDYLFSKKLDMKSGKTEHLTLPVSDVLLYWLEDGTKVMIRPSGTEPKVKLYCGVVEKNFTSIEEGVQSCLKRCDEILEYLKRQLNAKL